LPDRGDGTAVASQSVDGASAFSMISARVDNAVGPPRPIPQPLVYR